MKPSNSLAHAPATRRNREPIFNVLQTYLPDPARVLEIASGTGEHAVYLSSNLSQVVHWQPTDIDPTALSSIEARRQSDHHPKLFPARLLDVTAPTEMPQGDYNTLLAINMIHIAPWQAAEGLPGGGKLSLLFFHCFSGFTEVSIFPGILRCGSCSWRLVAPISCANV